MEASLRITPSLGNTDVIEAVYSYGHRNQQGMERHPVTGQMWAHEHGPRGGDELNIIEPGKIMDGRSSAME